jgi:aldehyde:ferredoxin oxidoreductase
MASTILPFQLDGVRFVIRHGGRALIGDEMGCGKTVSAIAILEHYRREMPALILVPANLSKQWRAELLNYASDMLTESDICLVTKSSDTGEAISTSFYFIFFPFLKTNTCILHHMNVPILVKRRAKSAVECASCPTPCWTSWRTAEPSGRSSSG